MNLIILIIMLILAAAMVFASFAGFWGGTLMIITALVAIVAWGVVVGLTIHAIRKRQDGPEWTKRLLLIVAILSCVTAFLFGLGAFATCGPVFLAGFYHWLGLVGSLLGFIGFFLFPEGLKRSWKAPLATGLSVYGFWAIFWLVLWILLSGSIDETNYPANGSSSYKLPFPSGESSWVIQDNNTNFNHEGNEEHAWDFRRPCGSKVVAARAGTVTQVIDSNDGHGSGKPNNLIEVTHSDGTVGRYLHIEKSSAQVSNGASVTQGQHIANVGNVGNSLTGHIHFVVENSSDSSIAVSFNDVKQDKGIPRAFDSYTSGN